MELLLLLRSEPVLEEADVADRSAQLSGRLREPPYSERELSAWERPEHEVVGTGAQHRFARRRRMVAAHREHAGDHMGALLHLLHLTEDLHTVEIRHVHVEDHD